MAIKKKATSRKTKRKAARRRTAPDLRYMQTARFIDNEFPTLKKYRGRKRLKAYERAHIMRLANIYRIVEIDRVPNDERPEYLRFYIFPGRRLPGYRRRVSQKDPNRPGYHGQSDASRARTAAALARFIPEMKRLARRKRLTPKERKFIERTQKRMRYADFLKELTPTQIKILKKQRRFKRVVFAPGINAIKLLGITGIDDDFDRMKLIVTRTGLLAWIDFRKQNNRRIWKFDYVNRRGEAQLSAMRNAAERLEQQGAKSLRIWTNHGATPSAGAAFDAMELMAMLGEETAIEELEEIQEGTGFKSTIYKGFAFAFEMAKDKRESAETKAAREASVIWVKGVVGRFERKLFNAPFEFEREAMKFAIETKQAKRRR